MTGYSSGEPQLRAEVLHRSPIAGDSTIVTFESNVTGDSDGGSPGDIRATKSGPAMNARCGDELILRIDYAAGSSNFLQITTALVIP